MAQGVPGKTEECPVTDAEELLVELLMASQGIVKKPCSGAKGFINWFREWCKQNESRLSEILQRCEGPSGMGH